MAKRELFDKRIVIDAIIVGIVYALIITLVRSLFGKEAARNAAVLLTALAVTVFRKIETIRFRMISDAESIWVEVPPINIWHLAIFILAFIGAAHSFAAVAAFLPETWLGDPLLILSAVGTILFTYFLLSFVMVRAINQSIYRTVALAVLMTQLMSVLWAFVAFRPMLAEMMQCGIRIGNRRSSSLVLSL